MFDLSKIKFIKNDEDHGRKNYSFVGIQRSKTNDEQLEFWLPLGFKDFNNADFEEVKSFFFRMYKTFKIYLKKKEDTLNDDDITIDRDGIIEKENGFSFENEQREQPVFYGKLNSIDKILDGYDELRISALEKKQVRSHEVDFTKLHRYMHHAVYLEDDVIYLDEMNIAKNVIIKSTPPILQLFCFIFTEIKSELQEQDLIPIKASELSEQFKENYLQQDSTLFREDSFAETLELLREILEEIDLKTTYKDEDFWHFYEAVEAFLYGERVENEEDIYWGFSSFYDIWEDMCQSYVLNKPEYEEKAVFADINGKLVKRFDVNPHPFELKLNKIEKNRTLKPDLVLLNKVYQDIDFFKFKRLQYRKLGKVAYGVGLENFYDLKESHPEIVEKYFALVQVEENRRTGGKFRYMFEEDLNIFRNFLVEKALYISFSSIRIVDYKYMRISDYQNYSPNYINEYGENKVKEDIHKQLVYEWTVQQNWFAKTQSEFWIPFFSNDTKIFEEEEIISNHHFNKSQIKLVKINFNELQNYYLQQSLI